MSETHKPPPPLIVRLSTFGLMAYLQKLLLLLLLLPLFPYPCRAGPITPGVTEQQVDALVSETRKAPPAWVVQLSTFGLMAYLQNSIGKQLKWLYPTNPQAADKWLEQEIYRWVGRGQGRVVVVGWGEF